MEGMKIFTIPIKFPFYWISFLCFLLLGCPKDLTDSLTFHIYDGHPVALHLLNKFQKEKEKDPLDNLFTSRWTYKSLGSPTLVLLLLVMSLRQLSTTNLPSSCSSCLVMTKIH